MSATEITLSSIKIDTTILKNDVKTELAKINKIEPTKIQYNSIDSLTICCQICNSPTCTIDSGGCRN